MSPLRLRSHMILYLSCITLLLSLIFIYISTNRFSRQALTSLHEYGESIALDTAMISADFFLTEDYASLQQIAELLSLRPQIDMVCIADPTGNIITSSEIMMVGMNFSDMHSTLQLNPEKAIMTINNKQDSQLIVVAPIKIDSMHLGYSRVVISTVETERVIKTGTLQGVAIGMASWILAILFGIFAAAKLSKPMQQLAVHTRRIQAGDFSPADDTTQQVKELGEFSKALDIMAAAIGEREASLQEMVSHLDNLPSPVFSIDAQFRVTYINPMGAVLTGLSAKQCIDRKCAELFNTPLCNTEQCPMRLSMKQNKVIHGETNIAHGDESQPIKYTTLAFRDEKGKITGGLESFTDISELHQALTDSNRQNWLRSAQVSVNTHLSGEQEKKPLCQNLLIQLAQHISFQIGSIYLTDENEKLQLVAQYAGSQTVSPVPSFSFGEGITGQAALTRQPIMMKEVPENYFPVFSASGKGLPGVIYAHPILFDDKVLGVIELGSFSTFDEVSIKLLERVLENSGTLINMAQSRERVTILLEQTRHQAEELQSQREELQASNEELREQTEILQKSEEQLQQQAEELQAQQEELQVTNEELAEQTKNLQTEQNQVQKKNRILAAQRNELLKKTEQLESSSRYKSEFLANMSHELRTPLNSVLILSQLFVSNKDKNLTPKQIEFAHTINTSGSELLKLINEVLDLAKIEAGGFQLDIGSLNLQNFVTEIKQMFEPVAEDKGIHFLASIGDDIPAIITTDAQRLQQIIKNLISNGIKFTEEGEVTLSITRPATDTDYESLLTEPYIAMAITDSGIGIALEKQKSIFKAFQQVDGSISRKYGGTGLGLSIAKEFATLLGGEIHLQSEPGHGSTFSLLIPETLLVREKIQEEELIPKPVPTTKPARAIETKVQINDDRKKLTDSDKVLLIIEDDYAFTQVLSDLAHERGFKCILASDGESGLHYADYYQPGAIILDIGLPGMDGWQVLDRLKKNVKTRHIPVHFMSAADKPQKARQKGAIGYLSKPVSIEKVRETFETLEQSMSSTVKRLLIIEDHNTQRQSMEELLRDPDIEISSVATGADAWKLLQQKNFDCMILDLGLQDMKGFKLLEMISENEKQQHLPVIIYTGRELEPEEEKKLRPFTDSIIIKGVQSPERLLAETTLFLHQVVENLPEEKQHLLAKFHKQEDIFSGKKILVVDDDMRNVFALTSALEDKGLEVLAAENGKRSLEILAEQTDIKLILMDLMMPEMDGFEAIARIRKQKKYAATPIIALTAKAMQGDRLKCIEAGASDYLAKPVSIDRLLSMLRIWIT